MNFSFNHSFFRELPECCSESTPEQCSKPSLLYYNQRLATELDISASSTPAPAAHLDIANTLSGNSLPKESQPIAQAYAGHQFGHFNPQLGDGRALILGELKDEKGRLVDLCLKGSGRTPFSRGGDGKAALGPMLREVLIAEAMHALGIPTTRSLAVVATGDYVYRDGAERGAVLTRTAASHIRIGTFEYFANRQQFETLKQLADYSIDRHFPELLTSSSSQEKYLGLLAAVCSRQANTIAKWMSVGFIHGVMNTDNMLISGETIDYGPCAFIDTYNPSAVFSSIDHNGRYAYKNQPIIAQWNLARFAECLIPIMSDGSKANTDACVESAKEELANFESLYQQEYLKLFSRKLGLDESIEPEDRQELIRGWLNLLESQQVDFTNSFRALSDSMNEPSNLLTSLFRERSTLEAWLVKWRATLQKSGAKFDAITNNMNTINPWIIPRNHLVEEALQIASNSEKTMTPFQFNNLLDSLEKPFDQPSFEIKPNKEALTLPADASFNSGFRTFCGT